MEGFMLRQITLLHEFVNEYRKGVIGLNRFIERIESIWAVIDLPVLKDELANVAMLLEEVNAYVIYKKIELRKSDQDAVEVALRKLDEIIGRFESVGVEKFDES